MRDKVTEYLRDLGLERREGTEYHYDYTSADTAFRLSIGVAPNGTFFLTLAYPKEVKWRKVPLKSDNFENVERMLLAADYPLLVNRHRLRKLRLLLDDDI